MIITITALQESKLRRTDAASNQRIRSRDGFEDIGERASANFIAEYDLMARRENRVMAFMAANLSQGASNEERFDTHIARF